MIKNIFNRIMIDFNKMKNDFDCYSSGINPITIYLTIEAYKEFLDILSSNKDFRYLCPQNLDYSNKEILFMNFKVVCAERLYFSTEEIKKRDLDKPKVNVKKMVLDSDATVCGRQYVIT